VIYAHEFAWDAQKEPGVAAAPEGVRLLQAKDKLRSSTAAAACAASTGEYALSTHIGAVHRKGISGVEELVRDADPGGVQ